MKLNLSSQIVLNKVPEQYYRPRTAVERSEITRCEKLFTDIYPKVEEGAKVIADTVETEIERAKAAGKKCVLALGTGLSLNPIYEELIRRHK
ncbi:MAG: glucosamine-6-phosphate deaminase, partial [Prevotella sp.]|nr:glucosamine-6-phosphate deaminase [Prevotella sp.]